jgi:hypothetical protein
MVGLGDLAAEDHVLSDLSPYKTAVSLTDGARRNLSLTPVP